MDTEVILVFGLAILIIVVGILTIVLNLKPKGKSIDYRSLFVMGLIWAAVGIVIKNWPFAGLGGLFVIVSLINKNKWEKNKKHWNRLSSEEKRLVLAMIIILGLLVLSGLVVLLLINNGTI